MTFPPPPLPTNSSPSHPITHPLPSTSFVNVTGCFNSWCLHAAQQLQMRDGHMIPVRMTNMSVSPRTPFDNLKLYIFACVDRQSCFQEKVSPPPPPPPLPPPLPPRSTLRSVWHTQVAATRNKELSPTEEASNSTRGTCALQLSALEDTSMADYNRRMSEGGVHHLDHRFGTLGRFSRYPDVSPTAPAGKTDPAPDLTQLLVSCVHMVSCRLLPSRQVPSTSCREYTKP